MRIEDLTLDELPLEASDEPLPPPATIKRSAQRWGGQHFQLYKRAGSPTPKPFEPPWSKDRSLLPKRPPGR
jgi:hypothetical protein